MDIITAKNLMEFLLNRNWKVDGKTYNLNELGWKFKGFDRSVRRLGVCSYGVRGKFIGLSKKMTELRSREEVEQTIRHEIAHAIDVEIRGTSDHSWRWVNIASQCGYNGQKQSKVSDAAKVKAYNWIAFCENHGIIGGWTRKPKNNKLCSKCSCRIEILKPTDEKVVNLI